jgi:hypothetical protein
MSARAVLMVRPRAFHSNPQTSGSNLLQRWASADAPPGDLLDAALREFDNVGRTLSDAGIDVVVMDAPASVKSPDAVFPNNWLSTHADGTAILYPMMAANRRTERHRSILDALEARHGYAVRQLVDLSHLEKRGDFVEGTGSLVIDRGHHVAYVALSPRSTPHAVHVACETLGMRECTFVATHAAGPAIYHTNVMLAIGTDVAVCCLDVIRNPRQQERVREQLEASGRLVIPISEAQMMSFGANVLELRTPSGPLLAVSASAWACYEPAQRRVLESHFAVNPVALDTIERVGGGGLRCMLAEILLPARASLSRVAIALSAQTPPDLA